MAVCNCVRVSDCPRIVCIMSDIVCIMSTEVMAKSGACRLAFERLLGVAKA